MLIEQEEAIRRVIDEAAKALLAGAQSFVRLLALRDVPDVHDESAHARLGKQIGHGDLSPEPFAIFMTNEPLGPVDAAGVTASCCKLLLGVSKLIGMDKVEAIAADHLFRRVTQNALDRRTGVKDAVIAVEQQHRIVGVLDQGPKTLRAFPNRLFRAPVLGDVFAGNQHDYAALRSLDRRRGFAHPQRPAILADLLDLPRVGLAETFQAQVQVRSNALSVRVLEDLEHGSPNEFVGAVAELGPSRKRSPTGPLLRRRP